MNYESLAAHLPSTAEREMLASIFPLSDRAIHDLSLYRSRLALWQQKVNLVAPGEIAQFWQRHVADSLQCPALFPQARRWIDLGSGAGFPGLVIAIALKETGSVHELVESNGKKCGFLREIVRLAGVNAQIICDRIERLTMQSRESSSGETIVTARALAPLTKLLDLTAPLLKKGATALFHKGRDYRREIAECDSLDGYDLVIHDSRIMADSVLLEIRKLPANSRAE